MSDNVNHPLHYNQLPNGIECIDVIENFNLNVGNAIKYLWRCRHKGKLLEDLNKALWYIQREIARVEQEQIDHDVLQALAESHQKCNYALRVLSESHQGCDCNYGTCGMCEEKQNTNICGDCKYYNKSSWYCDRRDVITSLYKSCDLFEQLNKQEVVTITEKELIDTINAYSDKESGNRCATCALRLDNSCDEYKKRGDDGYYCNVYKRPSNNNVVFMCNVCKHYNDKQCQYWDMKTKPHSICDAFDLTED